VNAFAQVASDLQPVAQYGLLGTVLAWLMYQTKDIPKDIKSLANRVDGLTRALLVDMAERESCGLNVKRYAREEIAKIDARTNK